MNTETFQHRYMAHFHPQQIRAVEAVDGPVLLLAVPGSGKTTVLVTRLGYMILCRQIPAEQILTMTYTVAATREMRDRFGKLFGQELSQKITCCTINALCSRILEYYARHFGSGKPFEVADNGEIVRLISDIYLDFLGEYPSESTIKDIRTAITYIKNQMLTGAEIQGYDCGINHFPEIYQAYCKGLRSRKKMDFDDQMCYALTILKNHPEVLHFFQKKYPYLCVDEAQDTSRIQHHLIHLLAGEHPNLFMVGDEDQSIYGFRAAYPQALLQFESDFPGAKVLLMEQNYRSTPEILEQANRFIQKNTLRREKQIVPTRSSGQKLHPIFVQSRQAQFLFAARLAETCTEETAILFRNNDSALPVIDLLERRGIAYNCRAFDEVFFNHRIIRDILCVLRLSENPQDTEAFMDVYYKLGYSINKEWAQDACARSVRNHSEIFKELLKNPNLSPYSRNMVFQIFRALPTFKEMPGAAILDTIWQDFGYGTYAADCKLDTGKFEILRILAEKLTGSREILQRLQFLQERVSNFCFAPSIPFLLSTIHSSKGLEYKNVYVMDCMDGILPAGTEDAPLDIAQREEERRLFYVAMTRAKDSFSLFRISGHKSLFAQELFPPVQPDPDNLFSAFSGDFSGKYFLHQEKGKGYILGNSSDTLLVSFSGEEPVLLSLEEALHNRAEPSEQTESESTGIDTVHPGERVRHKLFGLGTILSAENHSAKIRFDSGSVKTILLGTKLTKA